MATTVGRQSSQERAIRYIVGVSIIEMSMSLISGAVSDGADSTALFEVVDRARRRLLAQVGLREVLWGLTVALTGPVMLLALGTDLLPGSALWVFLAAGCGVAAYRISSRRPTPDRAARILDARWQAEDQLSTAYCFRDRTDETALNQRSLAERVTRGDVGGALPFEWPVSGWAAAAMSALAVLLLVVRVGTLSTLDLRAPLIAMPFPNLAGQSQAAADPPPETRGGDSAQTLTETREEGDKTDQAEAPEAEPLMAALEGEGAEDAFQMPEVEGLSAGEEAGDDLSPPSAEGEQAEGEEGDQSSASNGAPPEEGGDWSEESQNLLDRLKDAFEDLMETMQTESQEASAGESESGEGDQGGESPSESGEQAQAEESGGEQASDAEMEGGEQSEGESEQAADGQGANNAEEAGQAGQSAAASGTAEGSKEIAKQAELEAALDELEEFYQERAEDVAGEILVETDSSEQSLRTEYRDTKATHADRGGDVNRDEVPAAYKAFIERYFETLRQESPK